MIINLTRVPGIPPRWCAMIGPDPLTGTAGYGDHPTKALQDLSVQEKYKSYDWDNDPFDKPIVTTTQPPQPKPADGPLTDESPMPFGKHKGVAMMHVPVSYLHYLWQNGMKAESPRRPVAQYIADNLAALRQENMDLIWD